MNRNPSLFAFLLGLAAATWVAIGYVGGSTLAFIVSCLIVAVYLAGALEMRRFHADTATLAGALANIPDGIERLDEWLPQVPGALRNTVRLRIEGERVALPGPSLTPYLVGLLVLLGMLGTFLGMVVTLNGAVLALESTTDLHTIRSALAAPVKGLGVAFGTSVAGVATSAMLGLISTLGRRDRQRVGQLLDSRIAGVLRNFSFGFQRQETFKALQTQAQALPDLVGKLDAMMSQMAEQSRQLGEQLLAGQQRFHEEAKVRYTDLAQSVGHSLESSLRESATAAAEAVQPIVTATMTSIADETRGLHDKLFSTVDAQLAGITGQLAQTLARHEQATDAQRLNLQTKFTAYADTFEQRSAALLASVEASQSRLQVDAAQQLAALTATTATSQQQLACAFADQFDGLTSRLDLAVRQVADTFSERSQTLLASIDASHTRFAETTQEEQTALTQQVSTQLDGIAQRFDGAVQTVAETWTQALNKHEAASDRLTQALDRTKTTLAETFAEGSAALLADTRAAQAAWQNEWAAGEQERQAHFADALTAMAGKLEAQWQQAGEKTLAQQEQITQTLGATARDLVAAHQLQAETTINEVTRLMQTAAEAPKAAADVIGQLRQELAASIARDNNLLEERSRIMETLAPCSTGSTTPRPNSAAPSTRWSPRLPNCSNASAASSPPRWKAKPASSLTSAPASPAARSKSPAWATPSVTPCSCSATPTRR